MAVNGVVVREPGALADPERDHLTVDGRHVPAAEPRSYVLLHKPRGYVTSRSDPHGRPVVMDLVRGSLRLYPVGRLDTDVEGLLLLTNDGALVHRLLHPRYALPRVYEAEVEGLVRPRDLGRWRRGVQLDDGPAIPAAVELLHAAGPTSRLRVTFTEGRRHEVKRYCAALGHRVVWLRRVAFGPLRLGTLPRGAARPLTRAEVRALRGAAGPGRGG